MKIINKNSKLTKFVKNNWQPDKVFLHDTGRMYGIGCAAFQKEAIAKIDRLKQRGQNKHYLVLIPKFEWLHRYGISYPTKFGRLFRQFWPGNLTILLPDSKKRFAHLTSTGKIGIRIPESKLLRDFIKKIDQPIISTSINVTGEDFETNLKQIVKKKKNWFDFGIVANNRAQNTPSTIIDWQDGKLKLIRAGSIDFEIVRQGLIKPLILFVCTGNICRSPMAEYYFRHLIEENALSYRVASAGFMASGYPISAPAFKVLREIGIDAAHHMSSALNKKLVEESNVILTMTLRHKRDLLGLFPNCFNKTFTFSEFCDLASDIEDPYGLEIEYYRGAFEMIKTRAQILLEKLEAEVE
jgi:tRNA threonylcarbamoyl adenosine modification protein (Sua5/YciO/YrdC/YwlC family)